MYLAKHVSAPLLCTSHFNSLGGTPKVTLSKFMLLVDLPWSHWVNLFTTGPHAHSFLITSPVGGINTLYIKNVNDANRSFVFTEHFRTILLSSSCGIRESLTVMLTFSKASTHCHSLRALASPLLRCHPRLCRPPVSWEPTTPPPCVTLRMHEPYVAKQQLMTVNVWALMNSLSLLMYTKVHVEPTRGRLGAGAYITHSVGTRARRHGYGASC